MASFSSSEPLQPTAITTPEAIAVSPATGSAPALACTAAATAPNAAVVAYFFALSHSLPAGHGVSRASTVAVGHGSRRARAAAAEGSRDSPAGIAASTGATPGPAAFISPARVIRILGILLTRGPADAAPQPVAAVDRDGLPRDPLGL